MKTNKERKYALLSAKGVANGEIGWQFRQMKGGYDGPTENERCGPY